MNSSSKTPIAAQPADDSVDPEPHAEHAGVASLKSRANDLIIQGRVQEARSLLENAFEDSPSDDLRDELRKVYQTIVSENSKQLIPLASASTSLPPPSDRHMFATNDDERKQYEGDMLKEHNIVSSTSAANSNGSISNLQKSESNAQNEDEDGSKDENEPDSENDEEGETVDKQNELSESLLDVFSCVICCKLMFQPVTASCGHSFCRECICRAIGFTDTCPMCRTVMHLDTLNETSISMTLQEAIRTLYPEEYELRRKEILLDTIEKVKAMSRLPIFPLGVVCFPTQRFPMHVFEQRYQLMLKRVMRGSRKFGIVHPAFESSSTTDRYDDGENTADNLCKVGCVVEVTKTHVLSDGRSLIDTTGKERFEIQSLSHLDGYIVADAKIIHDDRIIEDKNTNGHTANGNDGDQPTTNSDKIGEKDDADDKDINDLNMEELEKKSRTLVQEIIERADELPFIQRALQRAGQIPAKIPETSKGPEVLGLWITSLLIVDDEHRQKLLEMRDSASRLREIVEQLEKLKASCEKQTSRMECPLQ